VIKELIVTNARMVTPSEVAHGSLRAVDGLIEAVDPVPCTRPAAIDLEGDYLIPGLVEIHTDNLEKHLMPRPEVFWPSPLEAVLAHDSQICCAGITTVLDAVFLGAYHRNPHRRQMVHSSMQAIRSAVDRRLLRAEHLVHLRCEVPEESLMDSFAPYADDPLLKLVSLNDHTPGQRQWREMETYKAYHQLQNHSRAAIEEIILRQKERQLRHAPANRKQVIEICRSLGITLASHDDTTEEDVLQAVGDGVSISEFPTTLEAARKSHACGLKIVAGAPNLVRGSSHSGNVSAVQLARLGLLDTLSSDYVPAGLLSAAFVLHQKLGYALPAAIACVTANPAAMIGLGDRGRITAGCRADLVRVSVCDGLPVVRTVWRAGERVC
jgi:alpha-D-ribose 1-methylphosphonate 5-triphosphate diphosphatase